ncbi:hypothetical protein J3E68DRAFT_448847 [Trichoderma sp. SZMC 28012]
MQASPKAALREQWTAPSDIFSVLLILGGDVVQLALVSLAGGYITPLSFSFGSIAYAISAVLSAIGEGRLITCPPEVSLQVINIKSGYRRTNQSWVVGRLFKTYSFWMPKDVAEKANNICAFKIPVDEESRSNTTDKQVHQAALCVAIYKWSESRLAGDPLHDWLWWSGVAVTAIQLGISAIPFGIGRDWSIFLVTAAGNILSYASGALPQWRQEKWFASKLNSEKHVALTLGNGSRHVIIVHGRKGELDFEALAAGWTPHLWSTRLLTLVLAILWLALLLTSTGIKTNTWYLLAVGGLGMLHNLLLAGAPRYPPSLGLPIELVKMSSDIGEIPAVFGEEKAMWTLMELEEKYEHHGRSLLADFFPGKLNEWEEKWWAETNPLIRQELLREAKRQHSLVKQSHEGK